jgi:hypothetical protein
MPTRHCCRLALEVQCVSRRNHRSPAPVILPSQILRKALTKVLVKTLHVYRKINTAFGAVCTVYLAPRTRPSCLPVRVNKPMTFVSGYIPCKQVSLRQMRGICGVLGNIVVYAGIYPWQPCISV